jgi:hypothetical protein
MRYATPTSTSSLVPLSKSNATNRAVLHLLLLLASLATGGAAAGRHVSLEARPELKPVPTGSDIISLSTERALAEILHALQAVALERLVATTPPLATAPALPWGRS